MTVILPTLNRAEWLRRTVAELMEQQYEQLEILIVDQSDRVDEEMTRLASDHPEIISYHHVHFRGLPTARNYGWRHARYEALLFLDDDIHCFPGLLSEHARSLRFPGVGIVGGAIEEARDKGQPAAVATTGSMNRFTGLPARGFHVDGEFEVDHAPGGNFSAWRSVMAACNGVDELLNAGAALYEETDLCMRVKRLGYRILFNGKARIVHLAVPRGGCRVPAWEDYVWGMAHNRTVIIRRHVRWCYRPVAFARLLITAISIGRREASFGIVLACLSGVRCAFRAARRVA